MIDVQIGRRRIRLDENELQRLIQDGRIPPDALIRRSDGSWVPLARSELRPEPPPAPVVPSPSPGIRQVLIPRRGVSATEILVAANLIVAVVLVLTLGEGYLVIVRGWTGGWWHEVRENQALYWWIPTLFLHAGPGHLMSNMVGLLVGAGTVEVLMGRAWAFALYLLTGIGGAWLSYVGHDRPPLSIGASGAVFGLGGVVAGFVIRRYRMFTYRQRWKARRVYGPLLVAGILPSLLNADYYAHVGGFVTGLLLGLLVPPHDRVRELATTPEPP